MANINIVLFQPDIAGNVGAIIRTAVGLGAKLHIIEPCGFPFDLERVKKSALDYLFQAEIIRHPSFDSLFDLVKAENSRLILASSKAEKSYLDIRFALNDYIIFGRESAGVPDEVANKCDLLTTIKMKNNLRCFNVAISCGIIVAKAVADIDNLAN
jgi:tRNA (cytidine/uridine-2'-O-)-methyltransferase